MSVALSGDLWILFGHFLPPLLAFVASSTLAWLIADTASLSYPSIYI